MLFRSRNIQKNQQQWQQKKAAQLADLDARKLQQAYLDSLKGLSRDSYLLEPDGKVPAKKTG